MNRKEKIDYLSLLAERDRREKKKKFIRFVEHTFPKFQKSTFHKNYYQILDLFAKGIIRKLIITVPPQHGKSEGSTRQLPAYMFGNNPDLKIAVASYNTPFARKFNRDIQRIIDTNEYRELFPDVGINSKHVISVNSYLRNADEFEIINHEGSLKAVGRGGALTGNPVDVLLVDDLYKDYEEGNSPIILESAWNWFTSVADSRLHNDSQQLIVFTRWNEEDLVGRIEKKEEVIVLDHFLDEYDPDVWYKINFEAIKETEPTELDSREIGEPLWPERHSIDKLKRSQSLDPENFGCLYQGNPQPKEGLLYKSFRTYDSLPDLPCTDSYTDTADTGKDHLCSIVYKYDPAAREDIYVTDVLYTPEAMEKTEPWTAAQLDRNKVVTAWIESNNGGRGFARNVQKLLTTSVTVEWFHQNGNKEARIYANSAAVQQRILFPSDWAVRWPDFYLALKQYKKLFKANKFDDAPDTITGIIEKVDQDISILDVL